MSAHSYTQLVKILASQKTKTSAVALIVAGALAIHAAPPERFLTALAGGSLGFSLLFAWLFFHSGLHQLPERQRGAFLLVVLVVLAALLVVQARAALSLATEVLHLQESHAHRPRGPGDG
ncbi:hypothetical protein ATI61_120113 [Archangium gephyra]|uniref:Uncharacterized protein n=1 Tax=Archangium gephyra TaxID=48 RepID=A0AAC8Q518_9BACT|nr:hypothetical protein [Archangium gephyra]AKJ00714.1 Hypothetical protein AA314_02340 [Archangium gephyra]REG20757.1 hypothetical protein ATI61_120113 [Archangium gephyra]